LDKLRSKEPARISVVKFGTAPESVVVGPAQSRRIVASPLMAAAMGVLKPSTLGGYAAVWKRWLRSAAPCPATNRAEGTLVFRVLGPRAVAAINFVQAEFGQPRLQDLVPHASSLVRAARENPRKPLVRLNLPQRTLQNIVALANDNPAWVFHAAIVLVGFKFALRASDIARVRDGDVRFDSEDGSLHVQVKGKADKFPVKLRAFLAAPERELMAKFVNARRLSAAAWANDTRVFVDAEGCPIPVESAHRVITDMLRDVAKAAGDPQYKFYMSHSLRSGYATLAIESGIEEGQLKNFGRWSSNAYQRYIRFAERTSLL
jgi:integrase